MLLGREQEARQYFQTALRIAATIRAPAILAHTQLDYAESLVGLARTGALLVVILHTYVDLGPKLTSMATARSRLTAARP